MFLSEVRFGSLPSAHSAAERLLPAVLTYVAGPHCLQLRRCLQLLTLIALFHACLCSFFAVCAHPLRPSPETRRIKDILGIMQAEAG